MVAALDYLCILLAPNLLAGYCSMQQLRQKPLRLASYGICIPAPVVHVHRIDVTLEAKVEGVNPSDICK